MKILNEVILSGKNVKPGNTFVLILDKREARTLVDIVEAAYLANKRRSSFRAWKNKLVECLECY